MTKIKMSTLFVVLLISATLFSTTITVTAETTEPLSRIIFSCKANGECLVVPAMGPQTADNPSFLGQGSIWLNGTVSATAQIVDTLPGASGGPYTLYLPSSGVASNGQISATWNMQQINLDLSSTNAEGFFIDDKEYQDLFTAGVWPGGNYYNPTPSALCYTGSIMNSTGTYAISGYAITLATPVGPSQSPLMGIYVWVFNSDGTSLKAFYWSPNTLEVDSVFPATTLHAATLFQHTVEVNVPAFLSYFDGLFKSNIVNMIYPSDMTPKPLGCVAAWVSDWTASAFIYTKLENVNEGLDTNSAFVNQASGKPLGASGSAVISFGGPVVNPVVAYAENAGTVAYDRAPLKFFANAGIFYFQFGNGSSIPGANLPASVINNNQDMFVIESYRDSDGRYVMLCYGFGWKGTYAAGKYFDTEIYPNLASHNYSWMVVKWQDANGNGFVNTAPDGDTYTVIATG